MYFLWIPAWCYQYCRFYKPACEHLCLLLAMPECTVVNAAIAAEEIEGLRGIDAAQVCSCLLCSAKCGSHSRCALECRQWIYVSLLVISFCQGRGLWPCWNAQDTGTLTEPHQLPFPPSHPSDLANAWSLYSKSLFLSKCRKNFKFSTFLSVRNMISHLKYA